MLNFDASLCLINILGFVIPILSVHILEPALTLYMGVTILVELLFVWF